LGKKMQPVGHVHNDLLEAGVNLLSPAAPVQLKLTIGWHRGSHRLKLGSWAGFTTLRTQSQRARGVRGFMLKRLDAACNQPHNQTDGLWWKMED
jgi:hypothetical protein